MNGWAKRILATGCAALVLAGAVISAASLYRSLFGWLRDSASVPEIFQVDAGDVIVRPSVPPGDPQGPTIIKHTFSFANPSDRTLQLRVEGASCRCTTVKLRRQSVPPGGMANLDVEVAPPVVREPLAARVDVATDNPRFSRLTFVIKGQLFPRIVPQGPQRRTVLWPPEAGDLQLTVTCYRKVDEPRAELSAVAEPWRARVRPQETKRLGRIWQESYQVYVQPPPGFDMAPGQQKEIVLSLRYGVDGRRVVFHLLAPAFIEVDPPDLFLTPAPAAPPTTVRLHSQRPMRILAADAEPPGLLRVKVPQGDAARNEHLLRVELAGPGPDGQASFGGAVAGRIVVQTDLEEQPQVVIKYWLLSGVAENL